LSLQMSGLPAALRAPGLDGSNLVNCLGREGDGLLFGEVCLCPNAIEDVKTVSQGLFEHLRLAPVSPGGSDANNPHDSLIDRERGLDPCHISILTEIRQDGKGRGSTV